MSYKDFSELCRNCCQQKYGFLVIDKDSALPTNDTEKDLTSLQSSVAERLFVIDISHWKNINMAENKDVRKREKIVREIEKMTELINKKHRVLKIGKIEEDIDQESF